jgi:imidazolonepropionase-like amidohydrolase
MLRYRLSQLPLLSVVVTLTASLASAQENGPLVLSGVTVIDGVSERPLENATVVVVGGKIQRIEAGAVPAPAGATSYDLAGRYVMPGLIDSHVHIGNSAAARRALRSGVTTARSMGVGFFADVGLRELAALGRVESPEIVAAGYHVRPRAAEGLFMGDPSLSDLMESGVRGEEAIRRVVRSMIAEGVDFIKTNATERAGLPETDPRKPLYSEAELRALVQEAQAAGIPVAAHAHGDEGGRAAVLAGVRSIEHGTYLSEETLALMAERGTYLAPTIAVVRDLTLPGGDYDNPVLEVRGRHMLPRVREMAGKAHRGGVRVVAATDTGYGPGSVLRLSHELIELVDIGMSSMEAVRAATSVAAELLGVDDHTGKLAAGMDADIIVMERNPLEDIGAVQDLLMVINNGAVVVNRVEW